MEFYKHLLPHEFTQIKKKKAVPLWISVAS